MSANSESISDRLTHSKYQTGQVGTDRPHAGRVEVVFGPVEIRCSECRLRNIERGTNGYAGLFGVAHLFAADGGFPYWQVTQRRKVHGSRKDTMYPLPTPPLKCSKCRRRLSIGPEQLKDIPNLPRRPGRSSPDKPVFV